MSSPNRSQSDMEIVRHQAVSSSPMPVEVPAAEAASSCILYRPIQFESVADVANQKNGQTLLLQNGSSVLRPSAEDQKATISDSFLQQRCKHQQKQQSDAEGPYADDFCSTSDEPESTDQAAEETASDPAAPPKSSSVDRLRSSLHSLRLAGRCAASGCSSTSIGGAGCPHRQPMSRTGRPAGVCSRRRSSAISAKSKAQYLTQYNSTKVEYYKAVVNGQLSVRNRQPGSVREFNNNRH